MNKAQREVAEYLLDKEERIIKQLERQFKQALEDVEMDIRIMLMDEQTPSRIHRVEYQKRLRAQIESTLENLHRNEYKTINQFLQDSYKDAFVGTMYDMHSQGVPIIAPIDQNAAVKAIQLDTQLSDRKIHPNANGEHVTLYESLGVDVDNLKEVIRQEITRGLATNMLPENIARNIANLTKAPLSRAKTIARTEAHRIQEASAQDARERAISRGARVVKQWDATMDGATREAHRRLDGQIVEVKEPFTYGTLTAMYPGDFGDPAQDCNCRCKATQRAKWMLDEEELEEQKRRAEAFGLGQDEAKKQQFAEYEKKYLKAAETIEKETETKFTPAKTKQEAEEYAKQFAKTVSYDGVSLENANKINEQLALLTEKYPIAQLDEITGGSKAVMTANYRKLTVSKKHLGKALDDDYKVFLQNQEGYRNSLQLLLDRWAGKKAPFAIQKNITTLENKLRFTRWGILDSYPDKVRVALTHEYGHILSDQYFGLINSEAANPNMLTNWSIKNTKDKWRKVWDKAVSEGDIYQISEYGAKDYREFFAECFAARECGEKLPDYIEEFMAGVLKNGIM